MGAAWANIEKQDTSSKVKNLSGNSVLVISCLLNPIRVSTSLKAKSLSNLWRSASVIASASTSPLSLGNPVKFSPSLFASFFSSAILIAPSEN